MLAKCRSQRALLYAQWDIKNSPPKIIIKINPSASSRETESNKMQQQNVARKGNG